MEQQNSLVDTQQGRIFRLANEPAILPGAGVSKSTTDLVYRSEKKSVSEVARLLQAIDETYEAACLGLSGLSSGSARHDFIEAKMTRIDEYREQLVTIVGHDPATALLYNLLMHEDTK